MEHRFIFVSLPAVSHESILGEIVAPINRMEESGEQLGIDLENIASVITNDDETLTLVLLYRNECN